MYVLTAVLTMCVWVCLWQKTRAMWFLPLAVYLFVGVGCVIMCDLCPCNTLKSDSLYVQNSGGKYWDRPFYYILEANTVLLLHIYFTGIP